MKSKLIAVISPAKLLDTVSRYPELNYSQPEFMNEASYLAEKLKKQSAKKLSEMMDLSADLGELNKRRYQEWEAPFTTANAIQCVLMFKGDVYRGLKAEELNSKDLEFAQKHLRILSGLYGTLRPLDLIQAYRLMMGTPFSPDKKSKNLYQYWGNKLATQIREELDQKGVLVNLASQEYFKAVPRSEVPQRIVTCEFKEQKGEGFTIVSTYAKLARGFMARYIIDHRITQVEDLQGFNTERYRFNAALSTEKEWVFTR